MSTTTETLTEIAEIANLLVTISTGAGVPIISLVSTIAANYKSDREVTPQDIAAAIDRAQAANDSLGQAIAKREASSHINKGF